MTLSGTPISGDQGNIPVKIIASDGYRGTASSSFIINIPNSIPKFVSEIAGKTISVNIPFNHTFPNTVFNDSDNDILIYNAIQDNGLNLPDWLAFDPNLRIFSGKPSTGSQGIYNIKVSANDNHEGIASTSFILTVSNANPIVVSVIPN